MARPLLLSLLLLLLLRLVRRNHPLLHLLVPSALRINSYLTTSFQVYTNSRVSRAGIFIVVMVWPPQNRHNVLFIFSRRPFQANVLILPHFAEFV